MKLKYVGFHDEVTIAATGQNVERGKTVDIEDDKLAKSLLEQVDAWQKVTGKKEPSDG